MIDYNKVEESKYYLQNLGVGTIDFAIVLGTGLSKLVDIITVEIEIPYSEIPHFPVSTVESHQGKMIYGKCNDKNILILSGRFHFYEGYEMNEVTYYVHVLKSLKAKQLIITNASGGLNPHYRAGEIVVANDHINLFPFNPLRGKNDESFGVRFPDMMKAYPKEQIHKFKEAANATEIKVKEGVYLGWQGPSLETPAEYKMARILGADMIGMSSVPEVIAAKYCEIPVLMVSIVSNKCYPLSEIKETSVQDVIDQVNKSSDKLLAIIKAYVE